MKNIKSSIHKILRWSEKYTKTDMVYLAHGGFWLTLGQIVASSSSFILAIAFANLLPKETFGIYKYILTLVGILTISNLRIMNTSITQSVAQGNEGTAIAGIREKIKWGLLGGLGAIILSSYYFINDNYILGTLLIICAVFLPFKDSLSAYVAILNGKKDFRRTTIFSTVPVIISAFSTITILYFTQNIYYIVFFYFAFWTITNFILFKKTLNIYRLNNIIDTNSITYGKDTSLLGVIYTIAGYFDKLIIFHFLGAASVAIYSIAIAPISQINGIMGNVNTLAVPKFSKQTTSNLKYSLKNKEWKIILITLLIALIYILLAKNLFGIFFPQYTEAIFYSKILALSIPLAVISRFRFTAIQSRFDKKIFNIYTLSMSAIQIILNLAGVYFYGLTGVILSTIAINICQFIATGIIISGFKSNDNN